MEERVYQLRKIDYSNGKTRLVLRVLGDQERSSEPAGRLLVRS